MIVLTPFYSVQVSGKTDDIKEFVSDVMTHGADLKFLTISGQKFVSLSKVSTVVHFLHKIWHCNIQKTTIRTRFPSARISCEIFTSISGRFPGLQKDRISRAYLFLTLILMFLSKTILSLKNINRMINLYPCKVYFIRLVC